MTSETKLAGNERGELGFWMCTALVVGNTIGMGIFLLPAGLAPYGFNALFGWTLTVLGCVALARVFARLARTYPDADGPYSYIRIHLGEAAAFLTLWCYWVSVWITNAALAIGVVGYLTALIPPLAGVPPAGIALALVWLFVAVNLLGARTGGGVQIATTALKLLPMFAVIVLGIWVLATDPGAYSRTLPTTPITLSGTLAASTIALYAMLGFESATVPAGKVRDPGRTIPRATLIGTLLTAAIYIAVSTVPILLIPQAELAKSQAPFVDLLNRLLGAGTGRWLAAFIVVSGTGALNGWTLLGGELTRTMAANGVFPAIFARTNRRGAPTAALLATGVLATGMVAMSYSKSLVEGFVFLTTVVTAANLPLYLCCSVALFLLWRRGERPKTSDLLVLATLGTTYAVFAFIGVGREPFQWALVLAAVGVPIYWVMRRRRLREVVAGVG
ncbi:MAG TPA: amino acid permease [Thermoanaerobaculia bacterium]|jgi:APA family basic amino acid/polyamine antiporter|nr:amino acid permease [Thermoanaerobaculia bacterium]